MLHINELDLFILISQGDEAAFERLFNLYVPQIQPVIRQIVQSDAEVKDIVQDVFLHLWLGRHKMPDIAEPRHWIFRITYNRSFLHLKRKLQRDKASALLSSPSHTDTAFYHADDHFDFAETTRLVQQAIAALPQQAQRIYQLNRVSGKKPADIADLLGISIQSVRNSLTRSGKDVRAYLVRHGMIIQSAALVVLLSQKFFFHP